MLLANIDGKLCAFDALDGYNLDMKELDDFLGKIDFYFKRSFSYVNNKKLVNKAKIHELGLNYYVTTRGNPLNRKKFKKRLTWFIKVIIGFDKIMYLPKTFEFNPTYDTNKTPKIIFLTRLYSPDGEPNEDGKSFTKKYKQDREQINEMRIALIKHLKNIYGDNFIGGLHNTAYARKVAPELIISRYYTSKKRYLKKVKTADICIASEGLHGSVGWKTGEYVAASKAIICEKMVYTAPNFEEGKNYYSFSTVDECLKILENLSKNRMLIREMQINNHNYYLNFLSPDKLIFNCISRVNM